MPGRFEDFADWVCPRVIQEVTFAVGHEVLRRPGMTCGEPVGSVTTAVSTTTVEATDETGRRMLAEGIDPRPLHGFDAPATYEVTVTCRAGHETFIRTESAR